MKEALLGFEKSIKHLDGHFVTIDRKNKITKPGEIEKIRKEGMPHFQYGSDKGDLFVTYEVEFPKVLNANEKQMLRTFFQS